jgi:hypothetical protein
VHNNSTLNNPVNTSQHDTPQALYSGPTAEDLNRLPAELKSRPQWVLWRGEDRIDQQTGEVKLNKIPIDPQTLHNADTTDPTTWGTFDQCVAALPVALEEWEQDNPSAYRGGGLGFVFASDDPYAGVDLDHCRDLNTSAIADWAQAYIDALTSYTEVTPSGTGLHILVQGTLPPKGRKKGAVEMYAYARFFTMTGWHLDGTPTTVEAHEMSLKALWCTLFAPKVNETVWCLDNHGVITNKDPLTITAIDAAPSGELYARFAETQTGWPLLRCELAHPLSQNASAPPLDDPLILDKAQKAKNGAKFTRLWAGDWTGYASQSEADLALCIQLVFWTQDASQLDRLFRQSGLLRAKWDEKRGAQTYGERTIAEALARQMEHYRPAAALVITNNSTGSSNGSNPSYVSGTPGQQPPDPPPDILLNTEITRIVDEGQAALLRLPHAPVIYQRARRLCVIARGIRPPKWLNRPPDMPIILEASSAHLNELATQAARWWKYDKRGKRWEPALPPGWFVETLQGRDTLPFPLLEGIVCSPTLRPDGSLLDTPGYDPDTGLFLDTNGTIFPAIPLRPTLDDARTSIGRLQEPIIDFPFAEPWHFSAALAAVLSLVCRFAIMGNVPLFAIRANTRGSGKSLLADVASIIGTGRAAPRWPQVTEDEEERKRLLTVALAGYPAIHIDNVTRPLGSPALDMALTAQSFSDRILGKHDSREAPLSMVWLASGNNMQFQGDTARRIVPIDLDPKVERPEERTGFQHSPLVPWVEQERPRLTIAALTILRAYFEAGCPAQGVTQLGSFEAWSALVRQALIWVGEADPCEGRKDIEAESDPQYEALGTVLDCWDACYPNQRDGVTLKRVGQDISIYAATSGNPANKWDELRDALGAYDAKYDGKSLNHKTVGFAFRTIQGRVIGNKRLVNVGTAQRAVKWCLRIV